MTNLTKYDLEERTLNFAKSTRDFVKKIPLTITNIEDGKQLIRSSGSVGANYIEANESLSKKDYYHRVRICRKEAKESKYWLKLLFLGQDLSSQNERERLIQESFKLTRIFGAILTQGK